MNLEELKRSARQNMTVCKMCRVCNGETCRGLTPGPGGKGSGSTFVRNVKALQEIQLAMRVLRPDGEPDCRSGFFGTPLSAPIFAAPIANVRVNYGSACDEPTYLKALSEGCLASGILPFYGDGAQAFLFEDPLGTLKASGGQGIMTVKPWIEPIALDRIRRSIEAGSLAIAMDVDAAGLTSLKSTPTPVEYKSVESLKALRQTFDRPFIVKGVMTQADAETALLAGAQAIVVSNHGGRVMDDGAASIAVLKPIADFVAKRMKVYTDGGYRSGYDIFKALALGADGVLIGRPLSHAAIGGGAEGVRLVVDTLISELKDAMRMTGCLSLSDITPETLHTRP